MVASTSLRAFSIISSIRVGWIRPSAINFSKAILATSRRTGSKLEMVIVSGVSSIIKSTPVIVSMALILRPSRPIIRPFISSFGNCTTEMVASATWSAAQRWMATVIISRAKFSASSLVCCSMSIILAAFSCTSSFSKFFNKNSFACSAVKPEIRSKISNWFALMPSASNKNASACCFFSAIASSFCSKLSIFLSRVSSLCWMRRSWRCTSLRRSASSFSDSSRNWWISSLPSSTASFFFASAVFTASSIIFFASSSAEPMVASADFFLWELPAINAITPTTAAITRPTTTQIIIAIPTASTFLRHLLLSCSFP